MRIFKDQLYKANMFNKGVKTKKKDVFYSKAKADKNKIIKHYK